MYCEGEQRAISLKTLADLASPEANGVMTAMPALAAIEALGDLAEPLHEGISKLNPNGPSPDARYDSYVPRLIANIVPEAKPTKMAKAKNKAK